MVTKGVFVKMLVELGWQSQVKRFLGHTRMVQHGQMVIPTGERVDRATLKPRWPTVGAEPTTGRRWGHRWLRLSLTLPCRPMTRRPVGPCVTLTAPGYAPSGAVLAAPGDRAWSQRRG